VTDQMLLGVMGILWVAYCGLRIAIQIKLRKIRRLVSKGEANMLACACARAVKP
jgi:hypothetical protein